MDFLRSNSGLSICSKNLSSYLVGADSISARAHIECAPTNPIDRCAINRNLKIRKKKWPLSFSLITAALKGHFISVLGSIILHTSRFYRFDITKRKSIPMLLPNEWWIHFHPEHFLYGLSFAGLLGAHRFFGNYCFPPISNCLVPAVLFVTIK